MFLKILPPTLNTGPLLGINNEQDLIGPVIVGSLLLMFSEELVLTLFVYKRHIGLQILKCKLSVIMMERSLQAMEQIYLEALMYR